MFTGCNNSSWPWTLPDEAGDGAHEVHVEEGLGVVGDVHAETLPDHNLPLAHAPVLLLHRLFDYLGTLKIDEIIDIIYITIDNWIPENVVANQE